MSFRDQLRGFVRAFRERRAHPRASESFANTLQESTQVMGDSGGMPRASTEGQHRLVAEGHEQYQKSFDDDH